MRFTLLPLAALFVLCAGPVRAEPAPTTTGDAKPSPAWCAPEVEALPGDVCHIDGGSRGGRRTLVIFLHGAIAKDTTWQWTQERALLRQAKQSGFEAIFPRAPLGAHGYLWPGSVKAQEGVAPELIAGWLAARDLLEARNGHTFDDLFVMGFSSGAYFVSALALRGGIDADGYAVFAGGVPVQAPPGEAPRSAPVFVGVCGDDPSTAQDSRSFAGAVAARGLPHRVDEQHIGHMFGDVHVAHAVSYLRAAASRASSR